MVSASSSRLSSTRRMASRFMGDLWVGAAGAGQGELDGRAASDLAFGPDATAVARDDPLHGGQADAGAGKLGLVVKALEGSEELLGVSHVEAGTVVAHVVHGRVARPIDAEDHARRGLSAGELPGVAQQV